MMASACLASRLPPQAFGIDDVTSRIMIGEAMLDLLTKHGRKARSAELLQRLKGMT